MGFILKSFSNQGFTLIEIVIVIVIILIIGGVSAPGIISYQESQNRERFFNQLENEIKSAQIDAMTKDIEIRVSFNDTTKTLSFCQGTNFGTCVKLNYPNTITSFKILNGTSEITNFFINSQGNTALTLNSVAFTDLRFETKAGSQTINVNLNKFGGVIR